MYNRSPLATPYSQQGFNVLSADGATPMISANDLNNLVTYASSQKPNLYYVAKGSQ